MVNVLNRHPVPELFYRPKLGNRTENSFLLPHYQARLVSLADVFALFLTNAGCSEAS